MTDREKIVALAGVMGWPCVGFYDDDRKGETFPRLVEQFGKPDGGRDWFLILEGRRWNPLEFIADAFEVQAKIPEGKRSRFTSALVRILSRRTNDEILWWAIANATARQRMDAVIKALELNR